LLRRCDLRAGVSGESIVELFLAAFGTTEPAVAEALYQQLINALRSGQLLDAATANLALALLHRIAPKDEIEAMLACQMIVARRSLRVRGVGFRSLTEALDATTTQRRLVFRRLVRLRNKRGVPAIWPPWRRPRFQFYCDDATGGRRIMFPDRDQGNVGLDSGVPLQRGLGGPDKGCLLSA
jgi:hypothetical protein